MRWSGLLPLLALVFTGCSGSPDPQTERKPAPRPVSVLTLEQTDPTRSFAVTGTVGSWKTEDIGFEVNGRVQYVIEPETNVAGPGDSEQDPAPLAWIDPTKYESAVESAAAQIAVLRKQKEAAVIEWEKVLPAQQDAAKAAQVLADADFQRAKALLDKDAIAKAEYDQYVAQKASAEAKVAQLVATTEAKAAEVTSIEAQIDQAIADEKDVARDLKDCRLTAPFRGQIAEVHVIPGGSVERGEPVITLQMMGPVKVEFEVSAERVRQIAYKESLNIILAQPDGTDIREEGVIYQTDTTADPSTRTFTITVLVRNRLIPTEVPDTVDETTLVKTRDIWKFLRGIVDESGAYYVEQHAIQSDGEGDFVWKILDDRDGARRARGPLFGVEKVRVTAGERLKPFLEAWRFRDVVVGEDADFDPEQDRVLGKLVMPPGVTEFSGGKVLFEREQWLMRPGDLVGVDLNDSRMPQGFYVPIDAISEKSGKYYVFAVDRNDGGSKVRQVEVTVYDGPNAQKRIEATGDGQLSAGAQIVLGGVHYLTNGEAVNVASEVEGN